MRAPKWQGPVSLAASMIVGLAVAWGCGEDEGMTPNCPELPLYAALDASPSDIAAREQAAAEGCVTRAGTATTSTSPPATGWRSISTTTRARWSWSRTTASSSMRW